MESSRTEVLSAGSASGTVVPEAKRRRRSIAERRQVVEETLTAGASVARVARAHGVNANQVFHWRRLYQRIAGRGSAAGCGTVAGEGFRECGDEGDGSKRLR